MYRTEQMFIDWNRIQKSTERRKVVSKETIASNTKLQERREDYKM